MKKIWMLLTILLFIMGLSACQTDPTDPKTPIETPVDDWKIVYDIKDSSPHFLNQVSVCYNIFPIAFADASGNGLGDLRGITENIDYFSDILDIDCLWLNPINPSPTYHKYDVTNYYGIDPQFGNMADFEALIAAAEEKGIKILMDLVINHTSSQHPWFINSTLGPAATYRNWYVWNDLLDREAFPNRTGWYMNNGVYYYASFWSEMPELNFDNPEVREEIKNITTFWLSKGVGGFRIDAARHIYDINEYPRGTPTNRGNINYFREFNHHVKSIDPNAFVVGEVYVNSSSFVAGFYEGMDSAFNFEFSNTIIQSLISGVDAGMLDVILSSRAAFSEKRVDYIDSMFLTNHDQDRIIGRLSYNPERMKLAARMMMTLPGIVWIYYGEELGMSGPKPDPNIRQPFRWGTDRAQYHTQSRPNGIASWDTYNQALPGMTDQLLDPNSILSAYIEAIALRKNHPVLHLGEIAAIQNGQNSLFTFIRYDGDNVYLVIHNLSSQPITVNHNIQTIQTVFSSHQTSVIGQDAFVIAGLSTIVLRVDRQDVIFN